MNPSKSRRPLSWDSSHIAEAHLPLSILCPLPGRYCCLNVRCVMVKMEVKPQRTDSCLRRQWDSLEWCGVPVEAGPEWVSSWLWSPGFVAWGSWGTVSYLLEATLGSRLWVLSQCQGPGHNYPDPQAVVGCCARGRTVFYGALGHRLRCPRNLGLCWVLASPGERPSLPLGSTLKVR